MKPVDCIGEEALGEVLELPESDPRRAHVATCPRCRALALSYRSFLAPAAGHSAPYGAPEDAALTAFRERLLAPEPAEPRAAAAPSRETPATARATPPAPRGWARLFSPALRPAWALAVVALAAGAIVLLQRPAPRDAEPAVRGGAVAPLAPSPPRYLEDGSVRLEWRAERGATRYEIRFYSTSLAELGRFDAGADPAATVPAAGLPAGFRGGAVILYRVAALRGRDEIALSATQSLQRP